MEYRFFEYLQEKVEKNQEALSGYVAKRLVQNDVFDLNELEIKTGIDFLQEKLDGIVPWEKHDIAAIFNSLLIPPEQLFLRELTEDEITKEYTKINPNYTPPGKQDEIQKEMRSTVNIALWSQLVKYLESPDF